MDAEEGEGSSLAGPMSRTARRWLLVFAWSGGLIAGCIAFADRPFARAIDRNVERTAIASVGLGVLVLLKVILAAAMMVLLVGAVGRATRRTTPDWLRLPLVSTVGMALALVSALSLKFAIGRSQVYPTYIPEHLFVLRPFHGTGDYEAFPSATLAVTAAALAVPWFRAPRFRAGCVVALAVTESAILVTNGHWLSDTVGGMLLGAFVGWWVAMRVGEAPPAARPM